MRDLALSGRKILKVGVQRKEIRAWKLVLSGSEESQMPFEGFSSMEVPRLMPVIM
jgi:hypothetical protein